MAHALTRRSAAHRFGVNLVDPEAGTRCDEVFEVFDFFMCFGVRRKVQRKHAAASVAAEGSMHQIVVEGDHIARLRFEWYGRDIPLIDAPELLRVPGFARVPALLQLYLL